MSWETCLFIPSPPPNKKNMISKFCHKSKNKTLYSFSRRILCFLYNSSYNMSLALVLFRFCIFALFKPLQCIAALLSLPCSPLSVLSVSCISCPHRWIDITDNFWIFPDISHVFSLPFSLTETSNTEREIPII